MLLRELFTESLGINTAIKYRKYWDKNKYAELFKNYDTDKNGFRLYLPLKNSDNMIASSIQLKIEDELNTLGFNIQDYKKGLAVNDNGKIIRIGKLLHNIDLQKQFTNDPTRQLGRKNDLLVCISRHPYDIAGASTGRGWTSCMSLTNGDEAAYLYSDIKEGSLIAYLINSDDKNLNSPIGRYLIKPFINKDNPHDIILVRENTGYGTVSKEFATTVDEWLNEVNGDKEGFYCLNPDVYKDSVGQVLKYKNKSKQELLDMISSSPARYNIRDFEFTMLDDDMINLKCPMVSGPLLNYLEQFGVEIFKLEGNYDCSGRNLTALPKSTPIIVTGDFSCADNPNLKSLSIHPDSVRRFIAYGTKLDPIEVQSKIKAGKYTVPNKNGIGVQYF